MKDEVRLSFDISAAEHAMLKAACAEAMIPMKGFLRDLVLKGVKNLKEDLLTKQKTVDNKELKNK